MCHGSHLLLTVEFLAAAPFLQFLELGVIGTIECIDKHEGLLVAHDVATDFLAEHLCVAIHVEQVVLKLECKSQLFSKLIQSLGVGHGCIGKDSANLEGTGKQHTGLEAYHLDVFFLFDVTTVFKVYVKLLSLVNFKCCLGEEVEHRFEFCLIHSCQSLICNYKHGIARKDGSVGVPFLVHSVMSSALVGIVHEVIVE